MTNDISAWLSTRLDADDKLADEEKLLVLAALEGPEALADMAGFERPLVEPEPDDAPEPVGAFLKQIRVRSFRGIGEDTILDLNPSPSLTVISGRNGSGKSSFAEALEVALTGDLGRWKSRSQQWKENWRNIHCNSAPQVVVTLAQEGVGLTRVGADWSDDADLPQAQRWVQPPGAKRQSGVQSLGWERPLQTYRPLLTYEELGSLLSSNPAGLYDKFATVLGLEQLATALKDLGDHTRKVSEPQALATKTKKALVAALTDLDDDRAKKSLALLKARQLDVAALRALALGASSDDSSLTSRLRTLTTIASPDPRTCRSVADELDQSVQALAESCDSVGVAVEARSRVLREAIALHDEHGDQPCPVCSTGRLDADQAGHLRGLLAQDQTDLQLITDARARYQRALLTAQQLLTAAPQALSTPLTDELDSLAVTASSVWQEWLAAPSEPLPLADHLREYCEPLHAAVTQLSKAAVSAVEQLDDSWASAAGSIVQFCSLAQQALDCRDEAATAKHALAWLKSNEIALKNERVQPIAAEGKQIWAELRQGSNVELSDITLASSNTNRHLRILAAVDGQDSGALAVMSQGELHSLALSLFLPRAAMAQSPFRFVVLDDPVQAMDPAKVEGLVKVLLRLAKTRQVIVFSHDDRFSAAVRRAPREVPVSVVEVQREGSSKVTPRVAFSPARRYLTDAFALLKDVGLPDETLRRILPGLLRLALEAQSRETYFTRALSSGASHAEVEERWTNTRSTRQRVSLALPDPGAARDWLDQHPHRSHAIKHANALHGQLEGDLRRACTDVQSTINELAGLAQ